MSTKCTCRDPWCRECGPPKDGFRCPVCSRWSVDGWCGDMVACCEEAEATEPISDSTAADGEGQS